VGATGPATIRSATDIAAGGWWAVFTYAAPDPRNRFSRFLRKRRLEAVRRGVNSARPNPETPTTPEECR
jgi:hypothetical protein